MINWTKLTVEGDRGKVRQRKHQEARAADKAELDPLCALQTEGSDAVSVTDKSQTTIRLQQSATAVSYCLCQMCFCWLACLFIGGLCLWNPRSDPTLTVNSNRVKKSVLRQCVAVPSVWFFVWISQVRMTRGNLLSLQTRMMLTMCLGPFILLAF